VIIATRVIFGWRFSVYLLFLLTANSWWVIGYPARDHPSTLLIYKILIRWPMRRQWLLPSNWTAQCYMFSISEMYGIRAPLTWPLALGHVIRLIRTHTTFVFLWFKLVFGASLLRNFKISVHNVSAFIVSEVSHRPLLKDALKTNTCALIKRCMPTQRGYWRRMCLEGEDIIFLHVML